MSAKKKTKAKKLNAGLAAYNAARKAGKQPAAKKAKATKKVTAAKPKAKAISTPKPSQKKKRTAKRSSLHSPISQSQASSHHGKPTTTLFL